MGWWSGGAVVEWWWAVEGWASEVVGGLRWSVSSGMGMPLVRHVVRRCPVLMGIDGVNTIQMFPEQLLLWSWWSLRLLVFDQCILRVCIEVCEYAC